MLKDVICTISFLFTLSSLVGQPWMQGNETPDQNPNFFEIQSQFEEYWKNKTVERGKGFKPFKRWEWYWEMRVDEEGNFPPAGINRLEYNNYLSTHKVDNSSRMSWSSLGPNSTTGGYAGTGRINAVAFDPDNDNIIYVGAAGGGIWKTTNGGTSWTSLGDELASIGVSGIVVHPTNSDIIYLATGDGDASDNYSVGVLKSTDAGLTWNTTGLDWSVTNFRVIRAMIMDPDDSDVLMVASSVGIYRTIDAGVNWTQEISGNFYDIELNPLASTDIFYACTSNKLYKSSNNGDSWTEKQTISGSNRLALATTADDDTYVYALSSLSGNNGFNGLFRSTDSGESYTEQSDTPNLLGWNFNGGDSGGQGWYDLCIAADPTDKDVIYTGGVNTWKSTDGGVNWSINTMWYGGTSAPEVHADKHAMEWQDDNTLWQGNDGGIYVTSDGGSTWTDKTADMVISQMYRIAVSQTDTKVIAGLQDNGTKLKGTGSTWTDEIGGDGMDCAIKPTDSNVMYGSLYYGDIRRSTNGGGSWTDIQNNISGNPSGAWVTPFILDPSNPSTIIAGFKDVYKSTNQGNSWTTIGSGLTSNNLSYVAIAPSNSNYIYVGRGNQLWRTTDGGTNWSTLSGPGNNTNKLVVNPSDPDHIYATRSNYTAGQKVYESLDGGSSWTNISGTLPNIPANTICFHDDGDETLYVGMDIGVYYRNNNTSDWILYDTALPNVEITDLEVIVQDNEIYAGTYGRGLWKAATIGESVVCLTPINLAASNIDYNSMDFSWSAPTTPPLNGYEWAYSTSPLNPTSGTTTTGLTVSLSSLESGTEYYLYVRSLCDGLNSSWTSIGPITTKQDCGDIFYDTGGDLGDYANQEDITTVLCSSVADTAMVFTFEDFNVESTWDALYIHNGDSNMDEIFDSGNPATQAGYPAGGYYGSSIPGPFTSTDSTGCLTTRFRSDTYVTELGWKINITCAELCSEMVSNPLDNGWGSLRRTIKCADTNDTIDMQNYLTGDTLFIDSTIVLDKNISLIQSAGSIVYIKVNGDGPAFTINSGASCELEYINIISGSQNEGRAILNNGSLILDNVNIYDSLSSDAGSVIQNNGSIEIYGVTNIQTE